MKVFKNKNKKKKFTKKMIKILQNITKNLVN